MLCFEVVEEGITVGAEAWSHVCICICLYFRVWREERCPRRCGIAVVCIPGGVESDICTGVRGGHRADTKRAGEGRCVIIRHVGGHAPEPNCDDRTQWSEGLVTGRAKGSARGLCRAMPWHSWAQRALGSRAFSIVREGPHFHTTGQSTGSGARINCSAAICADSGPSFVSFFFFFPPTNANQSGLGMQGSGSGFPNKVRAVTHFLGSFRRPFSQ